MRILRSIGLASVLAAVLISCGETTTATNANASRVLLTDGPFPYSRVARVDLHIVSVAGSLEPDTGSSDGFVTFATPNRTINVLALQNGETQELGVVALPTGAVTAVRMVIDTDLSSITLKDGRVLTSTSSPGIAWQSSAGRPVLNAFIHEQILVPDTGAVIVIDYDVGQAFIPRYELEATTDSSFIFSPVFRAADAARSGAIEGTVRALTETGEAVADASVRLYFGNPSRPIYESFVVATGKTDAAGHFRISFVPRTAYWAANVLNANKTYIIAVDPPPGMGLDYQHVPNLTVTAGTATNAGTVVLPMYLSQPNPDD